MKLGSILLALVARDPQLGYVQGMNFPAGAILYHCEESVAFWIFVGLLEQYNLKTVYDDGFSGMHEQIEKSQNLISHFLPLVAENFDSFGLTTDIFM